MGPLFKFFGGAILGIALTFVLSIGTRFIATAKFLSAQE